MNHYLPATASGNATDAANTRVFCEHFPLLAAFSFTLKLPYREPLNEYRALIFRFHTEVWQRTGAYSQKRQQARKSSQLTLLRWIREATCVPECNMVLMMDLNTPEAGAVHLGVSNITPVALRRSGRGGGH
ncbi:hypothetical protein [Enterobacter ludwigii]|uniref:hypothetical protein n=1 Tax=Enterobacter ludwigii TaxID=299767 RepID=UPI0013D56AA1|nr:hypothetical protein [Enterobacter ludwigii]